MNALQGGSVLSRMVHVSSAAGELYYLRLLLLHVTGQHAFSFASLQRPNATGEITSFQELAREMSLLQDDTETASMLADAVRVITSTSKLCDLFAEVLVWMEVSDFLTLWQYFLQLMSEHHVHVPPSQIYTMVDDVLHMYSISLQGLGISPIPGATVLSNAAWAAKEYDAELCSEEDMRHEKTLYDALELNKDQELAFTRVQSFLDSELDHNSSNVVFCDGRAGTGKTFLYRKILHYVRMQGRIALAVAFSGIAAMLLPRGRTVHSRFRLPVPIPTEGCACNIKAQSIAAQLHRDSAILIWDEVPMCHREMISAVDLFYQELMGSTAPFGGKIVLLGGDWRQIPPVSRFVERDAVFSMTLASLPFWKQGNYTHCQLNLNMRAREDEPYSHFCQEVGDGTLPPAAPPSPDDPLAAACVSLPPCICSSPSSSYADLLEWTYEGWDSLEPAQLPQFYEQRAVLAPTNAATDELNAYML